MRPLPNSKSYIPYSTRSRGALLLELLVAVSILAIILSIGSESVYVSMQSGKTSSETDVALGLANETLEAVRAVSDEKWQNIYDLVKGQDLLAYNYAIPSGGKWVTSTGSELVVMNGINYTRYFYVQNICRDTTQGSRQITGLTDGPVIVNGKLTSCDASTGLFDPSTQKVTVTVTWNGSGSPIVVSGYLFRWHNKVSNQSDWSGGAGASVVNQYESAVAFPSGSFNTSNGSLKLQQ